MDRQAPHLALSAIFSVISDANRYFATEEPWALKKTDPERFSTVLYVTVEVLRRVGIMLCPFIPQSAAKLLDLLAIDQNERMLDDIVNKKIMPDMKLPTPEPVFPRYIPTEDED